MCRYHVNVEENPENIIYSLIVFLRACLRFSSLCFIKYYFGRWENNFYILKKKTCNLVTQCHQQQATSLVLSLSNHLLPFLPKHNFLLWVCVLVSFFLSTFSSKLYTMLFLLLMLLLSLVRIASRSFWPGFSTTRRVDELY